MRKLLFCLVLLVPFWGHAQVAPLQSIAGTWTGALNIHGSSLPLVLHLTPDAQGAIHATLDSPAQGASGIRGENVTWSGLQFSLNVPSLVATYHATLGADGNVLTGTWSQGGTALPLVLRRAPKAAEWKNVKSSPIDGNWSGVLHAGTQSLRLVFHFHAVAGDRIAGTLDSLDQHAMGIPCANIQLAGKKLTLDVPAVHGGYGGTLEPDGDKLSGTWTQGAPWPLDLVRK